MARRAAIWHGTEQEARALVAALEHHCACLRDGRGAVALVCSGHRMVLADQRALDGLLWMRHLADRLRAEEFLARGNAEDADVAHA